MYPYQAEQLIRQELQMSARPFFEKSRDFVTTCANPACPSLSKGKLKMEIRKDGSRVHCWVCDWSGSWNRLAGVLGLQALNKKKGYSAESYYDQNNNIAAQVHQQVLASGEESDEYGSKPRGLMIPWAEYTREPWRGLSVEFLTSLGAQYWEHYSEKTGRVTPRIYLPFMQNGEFVGYTGRRLDDIKLVKYYNAPWMKAIKTLYPYDYVRAMKPSYVVLVEGQVDALNLLKEGIPTLCIIGTNNWSDAKRSLVQALGVDRVYLCMDGDEAGRLATSHLFSGTDRYGSIVSYKGNRFFPHVSSINLPDGDDPGALAPSQLVWLKDHVCQN